MIVGQELTKKYLEDQYLIPRMLLNFFDCSFKNYERYEQETSRKLMFSELYEASEQIVNP